MGKQIYRFGGGECDGNAAMKALLGGKGANLAEMVSLNIPVPPGFTITTEVCKAWYAADDEARRDLLATLMDQVGPEQGWLAAQFGYAPLVSVRSGAPVSCPGMMDTILNVGLTLDNLGEWCARIGERPAWDSYRRLIQMLGSTAYGIAHDKFEFQLAKIKKDAGVKEDWELPVDKLQVLVSRYLHVFQENAKQEFPQTVGDQLKAAITAVLNSWSNPRAIEYRKLHNVDPAMGTAVNVQAMVFGNMGAGSGTGVLFTRNPTTGEPEMMGEFLPNAQGEDVVAGIRTPRNIHDMPDLGPDVRDAATATAWANVYDELGVICHRLEDHYRDMLDIEFTVQQGKLWILQCRVGKRSAVAAFCIARQLVEDGLIDRRTALARLTRAQYKLLRRPRIAEGFKAPPNFVGKGASPGVAVGRPVFSAAEAVASAEPCILVTQETCPDDISGMAKAQGILTATGGSTSHAAVVARAMDKPCVVGCTELDLSDTAGPLFQPGAKLTIDGETGRVWLDVAVPVVDFSASDDVLTISEWALAEAGVAQQLVPGCDWVAAQRVRVMAADFWQDLEQLRKLLLGIASVPGMAERTVLDLAPPAAFFTPSDAQLWEAFGWVDPRSTDLPMAACQLLLNEPQLMGMLVAAPELPESVTAKLRQAGYRLVTTPKTVADLLFGDAVVLDSEFVTHVLGGQKALDRLCELLGEDARKRIVPEAVSAEYAVFKALAA